MGSFEKSASSFVEADALLQGRCYKRRNVHGNTCLERRDDGSIALRLHDTDVVTFVQNGNIILDSGGWRTVTTKDRINRCLPEGWGIYQDKGLWYLSRGFRGDSNEQVWIFQDRMAIHPDGNVSGAASKSTPTEKRKLDKDVLKYVAEYMDALFAGKVPAPSTGDCWYCSMRTNDGRPLGEAMRDNEHVLSHIQEGYHVPSLILAAAKTFGVSIHARDVLSRIWSGRFTNGDWGDIARHQLGNALKRYVRRQVGMAA